MSLAAKLRRAPLRVASGAYVLNSGIGKLQADESAAAGYHGLAVGAFPFLKSMKPGLFVKALGGAEVAVGATLLLPVFPAGLVGLGLSAFASALVVLYVRTPSLHDKYLRPTQGGIGVAKDIWLASMGYALVVDAALSESKVTSTESS